MTKCNSPSPSFLDVCEVICESERKMMGDQRGRMEDELSVIVSY